MNNTKKTEKMRKLLSSIKKEKEYLIKDIFNNSSKVIVLFILESPHVKEVKYKYPLAGASGLVMSDVLFDINIPFGLLLERSEICKLVNFNSENYSIMNVLNIPMQESAYDEGIAKKHRDIIKEFKTIRESPNSTKRRKKPTRELEKIIINDLEERLTKFTLNKNIKLIVPLGKVANNFIKKISLKDNGNRENINYKILKDIPHPSYNQWYEKKEEKSILKKEINILIEELRKLY